MTESKEQPLGQAELSAAQRARIAITKASRDVLAQRGFASSGQLTPYDVIILARYIETGEDPTDQDTSDDHQVVVNIPDGINPSAVARSIDRLVQESKGGDVAW